VRTGAFKVGVWPFWLVVFLCVAAAGLAGRGGGLPTAPAPGDTYYVVKHVNYELSLSATFLIFAAVYASFDLVFQLSYSRILGWIHFLAMTVGVVLISLPGVLLRLPEAPLRGDDPTAIFGMYNTVSSVGYIATLLGIAAFVLLLLDVLRRWVDLHRPRWSQR
jgi:heme/copper-type cytochrome/quinol oxidase subunit 1